MKKRSDFDWDDKKDKLNQQKHGVSFALAQIAFLDENRIILEGLEHSDKEARYYCLGKVAGGDYDGPLHLSKQQNQDYRCRLLAKGEEDI